MSRPVLFPPKMSEHKASGQARVRWRGEDYYLGPWGSEESRQRYAALLLELTAHTERTDGAHSAHTAAPCAHTIQPLLVCDVLARWLIHARSYYSERGRECEQFVLAVRPLERLYGLTPARAFGPDELEQLQTAMLTGSWMGEADRRHPRAPKSGGWSRSVVNARTKRVRTVWRWAERVKLVPPGSWEALRVVKAVRKNRPGARDPVRAKTTTMDEVRLVIRHLSPLVRAMVLVQFWSGMRSAEVRLMRAGDVRDGTYTPRQHKTDYLGHDKTVELGRRALAVLGPWLARALAVGPDAPVFPSPRTGEPWTRDGYCHACRAAADKAGLPHWHPYLSRSATRMRVSKGMGDEAARSVLGHRHMSTTLSYGERDGELAKEAARRLG